ncbi:MAG: DNA repair protein RecO [Candidatus Schekmanbacteria bacterium]|nr:DNA repair protein RecO [Candidatus Schekmanbacteria bacterium]
MPLQETQALVLRTDNLGEADKIVTLFSPQTGKIKGVANGARRPKSRFGSSLEVLSYIRVVYFAQPKGLHRLNQTDLVDYFPKIRVELPKLAAALYLVDLVNSLTEQEDSNPDLFNLLLYNLKIINQGNFEPVLLRIFEIRALTVLGFAPQFEKCTICKKRLDFLQKNVYNILCGGILCLECAKDKGGISLSCGSINFLKQAVKIDLDKIGRLKLSANQAQEVKQLLHQHILYNIKQEINSYRFLEKL